MIQRLHFASFSLLVLLLGASCSPRIYFPDSAPSFGFREKGHAKVLVSSKAQSASTSGSPDDALYRNSRPAALAVDAGYAFAPHWGVYGAYRGVNRTHRGNFENAGGLYNGRRGEGGVVYFAPMGKNGAVEAMAGAGAGSLHCQSRDAFNSYTLRFIRYSVQGALSIQSANEAFRGYLGMRGAVQHFHDFESLDPNLRYNIGQSGVPQGTPQPVYTDIRSRPLGVLEPYLGFEAGYRWIRFVGQSGFTIRYFGPRIGGGSFYATAGIGFQWPALPDRSPRGERE